jgi:hypothetical protein
MSTNVALESLMTIYGLLFSPCNPITFSEKNGNSKIDCHDIKEMSLKVVLNTHN